MLAAPTAGLDLPLKALTWEDEQALAWITYNDPQYLVRRHALASTLSANLAAIEPILERTAQA